VVVRDGEIKTLPIPAGDLNRIIKTLFDMRQLARGDVTSRSESKSMDARLDDLKKRAEDFHSEQQKSIG
jgi:hypothetical protein